MPMCNISCQRSVGSCQLPGCTDHLAFDCSLRNGVRAGVPVMLFEFLAGADGFRIDDAVDGEDAVEVVDFMLQEFGEIAVVSGFKFESVAVEVLIADSDLAVAFDLHEDREE